MDYTISLNGGSMRIELKKDRDKEFDENEDQKIVYELLNRYKQDKGFIQRDPKKLKFIGKNNKDNN